MRVARTVNMVYGDSSTMDVKYPVVWRERTELWISVWISMIFHDIPKKWAASWSYEFLLSQARPYHSTSGKHPMKVFDLRWDRCLRGGRRPG